MQLRLNQLAAHLAKGIAPLYVVHGDEPLLVIEGADRIRNAARAAGYDEREVLVAEPGFKWEALTAAGRNLSLFGSRKLIDLRIPSGKPGVEGLPGAVQAAHAVPLNLCRIRSWTQHPHKRWNIVEIGLATW